MSHAWMNTPDIASLLSHWAAMTEKNQTLSWGPDRAASILAHIAELQARIVDRDQHIERLRDTMAFNREQTAKSLADQRKEYSARCDSLTAEIVRLRSVAA